MNGTLRNHKRNTNQKSRKPKVEGTDEIDKNGEATMTPQSLEPLKLSKKILSDEQSKEAKETCIFAYVENMKQDIIKQNEENLEMTKAVLEKGHPDTAIDTEENEKYEELDSSTLKNEVIEVEEKKPSFQDQIFLAASNRLKKQLSKENILPLNGNSFKLKERKEIQDIGQTNLETDLEDQHYSTAKTLRMGRMKQEETYEFSQVEGMNVLDNQNTDILLKDCSSSETEQESDDFIADTAIEAILEDLRNLNKDTPKKADESKQVLIHESKYESRFKYKEKHYISKLDQQSTDNLTIKPMSLQLSRPKRALPVITTQPPLRSMQGALMMQPLPTTDLEIVDDVDAKICCSSQVKADHNEDYSDLIIVQYKSSCIVDCLCCFVSSLI
nr:PREDICTED: uncharacterized protein LOC109030628 [Bemisia tabaci]